MKELFEKIPQIVALIFASCVCALLVAVTYRAIRWVIGV
jgi:hypothetical protein